MILLCGYNSAAIELPAVIIIMYSQVNQHSEGEAGCRDNMVFPASPNAMEISWFWILWAANEVKLTQESCEGPC